VLEIIFQSNIQLQKVYFLKDDANFTGKNTYFKIKNKNIREDVII